MRLTKNRIAYVLLGALAPLGVGCAVDGTDIETRSQRATASDCAELQTWVGNDWRLSFSEGEVIEHQGERYQANQNISYPNAECAPDDPVSWCANWFTHLGECGADTGPIETCDDGVQNQDEVGIDCGGVCDACPITETCDDGVQNQNETGVDCGGVCEACPVTETCDDNVQNQDETGIDCGGVCEACPVTETCDDGIQNQDETGIDCGGVCEACSQPGPGTLIPAKIEAEDFDDFDDSTSAHLGDCGSGPVDQQITDDVGGGCNIGWTAAGEWLEYNVTVASDTTLDATLRVAARDSGKRAQLSIDGTAVGTVTADGTGWQSWSSETISSLSMSAGSHVVRVTFVDGNMNLNWLSFEDEAPAPDWTVDSLDALRAAIQLDNQEIVMKPGNYIYTDLESSSRTLPFSGSNNTIDLTGVYVEVPVGSTARASYITMTGSGNTIVGGTFEDSYTTGLVDVTDYYAYNKDQSNLSYGLKGAAVFSVSGSNNLIDGLDLTVRGSFPYGYGSIYGIGSGNVFGLSKRCGIVITGENNTIDNAAVHQRAFCHGIYMQSPADNTTIRNTTVEGVMRLGAELYEETESDSLPSQTDFKLPLEGDGSEDIPKDVMLPLSEDGIRVYSGGGSVTVENCTVERMRGGIRLYLASSATVTNSTAIDCGMTNYNMPKGGTISNSSGNFAYAPLNDNRLSRGSQSLELTILPSPHATGPHNIADIIGSNHDLVFHRTPGPLDSDETRAIVVSGDNSTILNETEYEIIVTGSGNDITSAGDVTDNGSNNSVSKIALEL